MRYSNGTFLITPNDCYYKTGDERAVSDELVEWLYPDWEDPWDEHRRIPAIPASKVVLDQQGREDFFDEEMTTSKIFQENFVWFDQKNPFAIYPLNK